MLPKFNDREICENKLEIKVWRIVVDIDKDYQHIGIQETECTDDKMFMLTKDIIKDRSFIMVNQQNESLHMAQHFCTRMYRNRWN